MVEAIREVDADTPILVSAMSWGAVRWLPYLKPTGDPHTVYMVHQYEPQEQYTHQEPGGENTYPGEFDLNWDGESETFDRAWLEAYLSIIAEFQSKHGVPVAVNEFGVQRWVPNAAQFMADEMELFEELGMNHALWVWNPDWEPFSTNVHDFNFLFGPDSDNVAPVPNDLQDVILSNWQRNILRP
jgi:hypothetical protein